MSKQITVTVSDEQMEQLVAIAKTRGGSVTKELIDQVVERGIYTLAYRTKYNAKQNRLKSEFKEWKASRQS